MINQELFELLCNLPVAVPPETEVILKVTSLSISPSVMVAHTSLKASFSLGVVYSLAVKAMIIPVFESDVLCLLLVAHLKFKLFYQLTASITNGDSSWYCRQWVDGNIITGYPNVERFN